MGPSQASVGTPPLPQLPIRGTDPVYALLFLPPPFLPRPQGPRSRKGPRRAEDRALDLSRLPGPKWAGETLAVFPSDPPIPRGSLPIRTDPLAVGVSLQAWEPLPSPSHPSGAPVLSSLHFSFPLPPPHVLPSRLWVPPVPLGVQGPPPAPGRCPSGEDT